MQDLIFGSIQGFRRVMVGQPFDWAQGRSHATAEILRSAQNDGGVGGPARWAPKGQALRAKYLWRGAEFEAWPVKMGLEMG